MTAVEIARARLAHMTAKRATPKKRVARTAPRHDGSGTQSALEGAAESALHRTMMTTADALPDDVGVLRALILAERAERAQLAERKCHLAHIVAELTRGPKWNRSWLRPTKRSNGGMMQGRYHGSHDEYLEGREERGARAMRSDSGSRGRSRGAFPSTWASLKTQ